MEKGGEKQELGGGSQEGCPLTFPYLASAHFVSKAVLQCNILLISTGIQSFHLVLSLYISEGP